MVILAPTERVSRHPIMLLGKIPDSVNSMRVLFKKRIERLVDDNDYPFFDADEFYINEAYGYALAQEKETMDRATTTWAKSKDILFNIMSNAFTRLGEDYQHKFTADLIRAHQM